MLMVMTTYACETLKENAELTKENAMLKVQNRELLARCDLLEAELQQCKDEVEVIVMTLEEDAVLGDHNIVPSLRAEISALREVVAWERECDECGEWLNIAWWDANEIDLHEIWDIYECARAEVDRLLKEA